MKPPVAAPRLKPAVAAARLTPAVAAAAVDDDLPPLGGDFEEPCGCTVQPLGLYPRGPGFRGALGPRGPRFIPWLKSGIPGSR